jgi:hypothetical protein
MKLNKKATSIAEAMVVMLIIVSWVTWMYKIYSESVNLSNSTTNKIQAIQIAKQWIEAFTNIRDTNWLKFSSDYENCWNVINYNSLCIWDTTSVFDIQNNKSYIIYKDIDNRWLLEEKNTGLYSEQTYRDNFKIRLDNWIYTQTWWIDLIPVFTREMQISYLKADWTTPWTESDPKIKVTSMIQWLDNTSTVPHKIEIEQILSNWKK